LLRASAKKRREEAGGDFDLHPATRRLFQSEVRRQFADKQSERRLFSRLVPWVSPRLAWAMAVLAIAAIIAGLLLPTLNKANSKVIAFKTQTPAGYAEQPPKALPTAAEPASTPLGLSGKVEEP